MRTIILDTALSPLYLLWIPAIAESEAGRNTRDRSYNSASDTAAASFDGTVIERTLGEGTSETIVVRHGAAVRLILHAPAGVELHLHGYDLGGVAGQGEPVIMTFTARHLGRFPVEAHMDGDVLGRSRKALAYIEVRSE